MHSALRGRHHVRRSREESGGNLDQHLEHRCFLRWNPCSTLLDPLEREVGQEADAAGHLPLLGQHFVGNSNHCWKKRDGLQLRPSIPWNFTASHGWTVNVAMLVDLFASLLFWNVSVGLVRT